MASEAVETNPEVVNVKPLPCPNPWCHSHEREMPLTAIGTTEVPIHYGRIGFAARCCDCGLKGPVVERKADVFAAWNTRLSARTPSAGDDVEALAMTLECCVITFGGVVQADIGNKAASLLRTLSTTQAPADRSSAPAPTMSGIDAGEPVAWASAGQLAAYIDRPPGEGSNYLPLRLTREGNFTLPLYTRPAPSGVDETGAVKESRRIEAWLRDQAAAGERACLQAVTGSQLERDLAAGCVALNRAADALASYRGGEAG